VTPRTWLILTEGYWREHHLGLYRPLYFSYLLNYAVFGNGRIRPAITGEFALHA